LSSYGAFLIVSVVMAGGRVAGGRNGVHRGAGQNPSDNGALEELASLSHRTWQHMGIAASWCRLHSGWEGRDNGWARSLGGRNYGLGQEPARQKLKQKLKHSLHQNQKQNPRQEQSIHKGKGISCSSNALTLNNCA